MRHWPSCCFCTVIDRTSGVNWGWNALSGPSWPMAVAERVTMRSLAGVPIGLGAGSAMTELSATTVSDAVSFQLFLAESAR